MKKNLSSILAVTAAACISGTTFSAWSQANVTSGAGAAAGNAGANANVNTSANANVNRSTVNTGANTGINANSNVGVNRNNTGVNNGANATTGSNLNTGSGATITHSSNFNTGGGTTVNPTAGSTTGVNSTTGAGVNNSNNIQLGTPDRRFNRLSGSLNLTAAQRQQLQPVFAREAQELQAVRNNTSLTADVRRQQMMTIRQRYQAQISGALTAEQRAQYDRHVTELNARSQNGVNVNQTGISTSTQSATGAPPASGR